MLMMSIESLFGKSYRLLSLLFANLNVFLLNRFSNDLCLSSDDGDLHSVRVCLHLDCFLHIIVSFLKSVEALDLVLSKSRDLFLWHGWNILYESNHGFITLWVKLVVIACL
jgi:hypothetical protein